MTDLFDYADRLTVALANLLRAEEELTKATRKYQDASGVYYAIRREHAVEDTVTTNGNGGTP